MRPFRSFLLLLSALVCFAGLSYILPWETVLPRIDSLIPEKIIRHFNAEQYADPVTGVHPSDSSETHSEPEIQEVAVNEAVPADTIAVADSLPEIVTITDPFSSFLDSLRYPGKQMRIMYYGDSQIEGDRITNYLRRHLRKEYGGSGPGLFLPVMPVTYTKSFYVRASPNWKRYNYLSYENGVINHNKLGPFMAFCRYMPDGQVSSGKVKAWIRITPSVFADPGESRYEFLRILYRNTRSDVYIQVKAGDNPVITDTLRTGDGIRQYVCPLYDSKNILIDLSGRSSPDIYGISIESREGVIVDNIPQRGSAGLEFTMVDKENLKEAFGLLGPDLIVMHYGLNLAMNIRNDYHYYERGLERQLSLIREISPGIALLVVGLSDMAYVDGETVKPYPNMFKIIDAQKAASGTMGARFWDARESMGGKSSIVRWFSMNPPLAKKDYIHLTDQGADTLAKLMAEDLFIIREPFPSQAEAPPSVSPDTSAYSEKQAGVISETNNENPEGESLVSLIFRYHPDEPFIFTTPSFWIFFLFVLAGFGILYKKLFIRNLYLLLISLFFYYKTGGLFLVLLIIVTIIDYSSGLLIYRSKTRFMKRCFLILSIVSNIGILAYFKYTGFFVETINNIIGTDFVVRDFLSVLSNNLLGTNFNVSNIILPVGISFFTFQSLSYTIDMYREKLEPVRNILDFGFFVSFFPQLVAGPIVRASEFIPQLYSEYNVSKREFSHAVFLIMKGLIKKIVISDFIAVNFVDRVFELPTAYSGFENLMAVYGYGLQIYCDFSGYTDIAIGLGLVMGFRLPFNFNSPYKALNLTDFWKRWHISLSRWLKDYLYIPLGGNRKGIFRTNLNLLTTMLIGGLWHGADLRFLIWGGLHGVGLVLDKLVKSIFGRKTSSGWLTRTVSVFLTFNFVSFCWIFFRAQDMHYVSMILNQVFLDFLPSSFAPLMSAYTGVFALMAAAYLIHFLPEKLKESYRGLFIRIPLAMQMVIVLMIAFLLYHMRTTEIIPFIYFRF